MRLDDDSIASRRVVGGGGVRGVASSRETVVDRASRVVVRRCVSRRRRRVENVIENIENIKTSETFVDLSVDVEAEFKRGLAFGIEEIRPRFTPSAISSADRGLPIADALVATSAQVFVAALALSAGTPRPSWLVPFGPSWRGAAYVLPAIAHGAKLASLWVCGALAARAYERDAFDGSLGEAVRRTLRGGCFATGLLLLVTQSEVAAEFAVKDLGDPVMNASREGDAILYRATSELVVDVVSEATAIVGWRMIRWNTSPTDPETILREDEERARRRRR